MTIPYKLAMVGGVNLCVEAKSMDDEHERTRAIAKAFEEGSKAVQGLTEQVGKAGSWMARVMGTAPEDIVGIYVTDRLRFLRIHRYLEHFERLQQKVEYILEQRGIEDREQIDPKHAIPAFEAAAEESDETLQNLWARLLANAMDPNCDISLRRNFVETLRRFEPLDVLVFEKLATLGRSQRTAEEMSHAMGEKMRLSLIQVSLNHLMKLDCAVIIDVSRYELAPLGRELRHAIGGNGQL